MVLSTFAPAIYLTLVTPAAPPPTDVPAAPAVSVAEIAANTADPQQQSAPPAPMPMRPMNFGPYPSGWQIDLGPGVFAVPRFPGSDGLRILPIPQIDIRYKNKFFASVQTGIGYNVINTKRWRAGPILRPDFGRTARDIAVFPGLDRISVAPELGAFVTYQPSLFTSIQLEVRQAAGGHEGLVADLTLRKVKLMGKWTLGYGGRVRFADATYLRAYHGVTPAESITSGLRPYRPGASFTDVALSGFASRRIGGNWSAAAFGSYARLVGDAAGSPISSSSFGSRNQVTLGANISYRFRFN